MSMLKHLLFKVLPSPQKLDAIVGGRDLIYRRGYGQFCYKLQKALAKWHHREMLKRDAQTARAQWHRRELLRRDPEFAILEGVKNLLIEKSRAHEAGISPSDPQYPVLRIKIEKWW